MKFIPLSHIKFHYMAKALVEINKAACYIPQSHFIALNTEIYILSHILSVHRERDAMK